MKKISIIILLGAILLSGCAKNVKPTEPVKQERLTTENEKSINEKSTNEKSDTNNISGMNNSDKENNTEDKKAKDKTAPTIADLEKLTQKLEKTKDEEERKKILGDIQVILEEAEKNAEKQAGN